MLIHTTAALIAGLNPEPTAIEVAQPTREPLTCEAPGGDYQPYELMERGRFLSGRITLLETKKDPRWAPAAGFLFVLPGEQLNKAGVQVFVPFDRPDKLAVGLKKPGNERPILLARVSLGKPVDVEAKLEPDGRLTVWAAGKTKTVRIRSGEIMSHLLMCSSGKFLFENVSAPTAP